VMHSLSPVNGTQRYKWAYTEASVTQRNPSEVHHGRGRVSCINGL
jgi:hypothetical protein